MDEVHTFNDCTDDFGAQLGFYKENPSFLHPPLFFMLTHQFYPFGKPGKGPPHHPFNLWDPFHSYDLPPCQSFLPPYCPPMHPVSCFYGIHISLSQDGRSYALLMFLGMASLYFFVTTSKDIEKKVSFPCRFLVWPFSFILLIVPSLLFF